MERRRFLTALGGVAAAAGVAAFKWPFSPHEAHRSLLIGGSSTMLELSKALTAEFQASNPGLAINIEGGGSVAGVIALKRGAIDLAAMSRDLTADEDDRLMRNYLIARDAILLVVNSSMSMDTLSKDMVKRLLEGEIDNWKAVGGPDLPVSVITRAVGSTTLRTVEDMILSGGDLAPGAHRVDNAVEMVKAVEANPAAIGFLALKDANPRVKALPIEGVPMNRETVLSGRYPFSRSFYYATYNEQNGVAKEFVTFAQGPKGQKIAEQKSLLAVC